MKLPYHEIAKYIENYGAQSKKAFGYRYLKAKIWKKYSQSWNPG